MIRVEGLVVDRRGERVLDGVSFAAGHGETVAVVGASGSGKSTLLLALAGCIPLRTGSVAMEDGTRIGYVPPLLASWPVVRADEFLEFCAASSGLAGKPLQEAVARGLAMAGLAGRPSIRIDALSDAAKKRLLLARGLLGDPDLLLVDDPFVPLDPAGCLAVERLVDDAGLAGRSVIAAVNAAHLRGCWSRVLLLDGGRIRRDLRVERSVHDADPWWGERLLEPGFREAGDDAD